MMHGLRIFDALELKFTPPQVCPVHEVDPSKLASEGCVYSLKFCTMHQPEKVGMVSSSSDTHVTLVAEPCCQLSYIYPMFSVIVIFWF